MSASLTRRLMTSSVMALVFAAGAGLTPAMATPPAEAVVQRQDGSTIAVSWRAAGPVDVLVADRADAPVQAARLVAAADDDGHALVPEIAGDRSYVLLRDVASGDVARVAERVIPLEAGSNFRDIGGYPAAGGRVVKWGLIYRSAATPMLTAADQARIAGLGITHMVDLRSSEERVLAPTRINAVPVTAIGYRMVDLMADFLGSGGAGEGYRRLPEVLAPHLRQVFGLLLRGEGPVAYNCSAGQDRTGFTTAIILAALGTPYATIVEDYHLSTRYRRPEFEMPRISTEQASANQAAAMFARFQNDPHASQPQPLMTAQGKAYLDFAFAEMKDRWGGVDGYLAREIGLTPADIAMLRARYTM